MLPQEQQIEEAINQALIREAEAFRDRVNIYSNWASQMGHPCLRYLCYHRTHWKQKEIPGINMLNLFGLGKPLENVVEKRLQMAGYEIYEDPESINWKKFQISGRIDRKMKYDGQILPVEIKGLSPHSWNQIDDIDSFFLSDKYYMKMYPTQLILYCFHLNKDQGIFALLNKLTGQIKICWLYVEQYLDVAEQALQKATKVNEYVKNFENTNDKKKQEELLPERINNFDICKECGFRHLCQPVTHHAKKAKQVDVPNEFIDLLERREQLKESKAEYEKIDRQIKKFFKENEFSEDVIIGKFIIQALKRHRKETLIPESDYIQYKITRIEE
ncbi:MAG TPA: hypothetical protein ENI52_01225 [Thermoplasmata archaeon]|nr:hypothetical protein [Thermoplasmata archaeon]